MPMIASRGKAIPDAGALAQLRKYSATPLTSDHQDDAIDLPMAKEVYSGNLSVALGIEAQVVFHVYAVSTSGVQLQVLADTVTSMDDNPTVIGEITPVAAGQLSIPLDPALLNSYGFTAICVKAVVGGGKSIIFEAEMQPACKAAY